MSDRLYADRDLRALNQYYLRHTQAMTAESLHSKADIAAELGWRDKQIADLQTKLADCSEYLKDRETPAQCISRNRADLVAALGYWADEKKKTEALETKLAAAERLMSQVVEEHADPESWTYNFCEDEPCEWCLEASAAINHPGSIDRDSTEGVNDA